MTKTSIVVICTIVSLVLLSASSSATLNPANFPGWWVYRLMDRLYEADLLTEEEYSQVAFGSKVEDAPYVELVALAISRAPVDDPARLDLADFAYFSFSDQLRIVEVEPAARSGQLSAKLLLDHQLVPTFHWAYETMRVLRRHGFLEDYPDGFFDGSVERTNFDFGIATDRLLNEIDTTAEVEDHLRLLAEVLRHRFISSWYEEYNGTLSLDEWYTARARALTEGDFGAFESGSQLVPAHHWAYVKLRLLQRAGLLATWPSDYFSGNQLRQRKHFAEAIGDVWDTVDAGRFKPVDETDDETLRAVMMRLIVEFAEELTSRTLGGPTSQDEIINRAIDSLASLQRR